MKIRKANLAEVNEVRLWLMDTANWLNEVKIPQWKRFLDYKNTEICLRDYIEDKLYVLENDNNLIIGALAFGEAEDIDKILWQEPEKGLYIHRIIVSKDFRGLNNGKFMINWAMNMSKKKHKELRLNCVEENKELYYYYMNKGFIYAGSKEGYHLFKI